MKIKNTTTTVISGIKWRAVLRLVWNAIIFKTIILMTVHRGSKKPRYFVDRIELGTVEVVAKRRPSSRTKGKRVNE